MSAFSACDLGNDPKSQAEKALKGAQDDNERLQEILGTRRQPDVSAEYKELKKAIVEEALTGKYSFADDPDCAANYILSGSEIRKINSKYIDELAYLIKNNEYDVTLYIPPIVEKNEDDDSYTIISGHHRYKAHLLCKKKEMVCVIAEFS